MLFLEIAPLYGVAALVCVWEEVNSGSSCFTLWSGSSLCLFTVWPWYVQGRISELILLRTYWASWTFCIGFGVLEYSLCPSLLPQSFRAPFVHRCVRLIIFHTARKLCLFSLFSVCSPDWIISADLPVCWFLLLSAQVCCWHLLVNFSPQLLYFLYSVNFHFVLFLYDFMVSVSLVLFSIWWDTVL